jgi:hypothetical protein
MLSRGLVGLRDIRVGTMDNVLVITDTYTALQAELNRRQEPFDHRWEDGNTKELS